MIIQALAFYLFAAVALGSGVMVISSRNPVHSVMFLILAFFSAGGLFVLMGAEFLAMLLVVVYVGAVAVLFLFVVMMLDLKADLTRQTFATYLPIGLIVGGLLAIELIFIGSMWVKSPEAASAASAGASAVVAATNSEALGNLIYTRYVYLFQVAGLILLVAMIGAIVLTLRTRQGVKRQNVGTQFARQPKDVIEVRKVESRTGV